MSSAETPIPELQLFRRGKVRDVYEYEDKLLLVATDRISAFDCVLPTAIPFKGAVLTQLSRFWFEQLGDIIPNHMISADAARYPAALQPYRERLAWRSMLVERATVVPFECVVRGYLAGSGWKSYRQTGRVCGIRLPAGLREADQLPEPIFTPTTKAEAGHDRDVTREELGAAVGPELAARLEEISLGLYRRAAALARQRGIIIADTKFEFGRQGDSLMLIDEALTPDSSRFWPLTGYDPGRTQPSFDKQPVRDYLDSLDWDKQPPAPALPPAVAHSTSERYLEAYRILTGQSPPFTDN